MKKITYSILIIFIFSCELFSQDYRAVFPYFYDIKELDVNYILIPNNNYGFLTVTNHDYPNVRWIHYDIETIVYEQGLFFIGKLNEEIFLSEAMWGSLYSPGPILDDKPAMISHPEDSSKYRVYKISKNDLANSNIDIIEWPLQWGAPVFNPSKIKLYGDQMLWTIYNGLDSNSIVPLGRNRDDYPSFPIEIHQNTFAYKSSSNTALDFLDDVIFFEYTLINKGIQTIDSAYIGIWTDIDFYGENNYPAVDTSLQIGYCWSNFTPNNQWCDSTRIPAIGYIQLFGPEVSAFGDSAIYKGEIKTNYKNLEISSFWGFHDDSYPDTFKYGPAYSRNTAWNIARGLDKHGKDITDPYTGKKTTFRYSGDPVSNAGWLSTEHPTSGGAGFYLFSGPFNMSPSDTQWVMYALIAVRGNDNFGSVLELRKRAEELRNLRYDELVIFSELEMNNTYAGSAPEQFKLMQNYPNPFNKSTKIEYEIPIKSHIKIELFNILGQKISTLLDTEKEPGNYSITLHSTNLSSGLYLYKMTTATFSSTEKMVLLK